MPLNWLSNRQTQLHKILDEDGDRFELILKKAMTERKMISLTLKNNKTYFGFVTAPLNPALKMRSISIVPFRSGYRDDVTKALNFTTEYWKVFEAFTAEGDQKEKDLKQEKENQNRIKQLQVEKRKELAQAESSLAQIERSLTTEKEQNANPEAVSQNGAISKEGITVKIEELKGFLQGLSQHRSDSNTRIKILEKEIIEIDSRYGDYETTVPVEEVCILSIYHHKLYEQYFAPRIDEFDPMTGVIGSAIKIKGLNFATATEVKFNGVNARNFIVKSSTEIEAIVPENALSGPICISTPGGKTTSPISFSFLPPPTISGVAPGSTSVSKKVRIIGTNLGDTNEVTFNGLNAEFGVDSSTQITATVPTGATSGPVTVKTPGGSNISPGTFNVTS